MRWRLPTFRHPSRVGIAIGKRWTHLARVTKISGGYQVEQGPSIETDQLHTLATQVAALGWNGAITTISVVDQLIKIRELSLPELSSSDLKKVLQRETAAERQQGQLAAWHTQPDVDDGTLVTIRSIAKSDAQTWIDAVRGAGLVPHDIVPHAAATSRVTLRPEDQEPGQLISLLDIWEHHSDLVLVRNGYPFYNRHLSRGWDGTSLEAKQAESVASTDHTATPEQPSYGEVPLGDDAPAKPVELAKPVKPQTTPPAWERLLEEIRRTQLYVKKNLQAGNTTRTVLLGPLTGAQHHWLNEAMDHPAVTLVEQRRDLTWDEAPNPRKTTAVGAALCGFTTSQQRLVPAGMTRSKRTPIMAGSLGALLICVMLSASFGLWSEAKAISGYKQHIAGLKSTLQQLQQQAPPAPGQDPAHIALNSALASQSAAFPGAALLSVLGRTLPGNGRLVQLDAQWDNGWTIAAYGEIEADPITALRLVGQLVNDLNRSGLFATIRLNPVQATRPYTGFHIDLTIGERHGHSS